MTGPTRRVGVAMTAVAVMSTAGCLQVQTDRPPRPVAAVADATTGGTVTVAITSPTSIDPALVPPADSAGTLVVRTMCDSLTATDPATGKDRPDIAAGVLVGAGGTVVTIRLRRGVRFSDGSRLTSADVVAALTRVARPEVASPNADLLQHVQGFQQLQQDEDKAHGRLAGLSALDPRTVQVALTTPDAGWVRTLATTVAVPIPRRHGADNGFGAFSTRPTCVGPYRLATPWRPGEPVISLVRSKAYDGGDPGDTRAGRGWADRIVFRIYPSEAAAYDAYRRGEVDVAQVPAASADVAGRLLGSALVRAPDATLGYLGLPTTVAPYDDPQVRIALSMAMDRAAIVRDVYHDGRTPAQGLYAPVVGDGVWREAACGQNAPVSADAAGARALLGPRIEALRRAPVPLYFDDEFANRALVTEVAAQWHRALGVTVRPVAMDFADYLPKAMQAPGFDGPFRLSYAAATASPADYVRDLVTAAGIDTTNATRFIDHAIEQTFTHEASTRYGARSDPAWRAIETEFCSQLPLIPVTFNDQVWAWRASVGAAGARQLDRSSGLPLLREAFRRHG
jgi:ABC-type transport system substrate-binding protein